MGRVSKIKQTMLHGSRSAAWLANAGYAHRYVFLYYLNQLFLIKDQLNMPVAPVITTYIAINLIYP
jgi:hypothetical protein